MVKSTWREQTINLIANQVRRVTFFDTRPNFVIVTNRGNVETYLGFTPAVSSVNYEEIITAFGRRIITRPVPYDELHLVAAQNCKLFIESEEQPFNPAAIQQTHFIGSITPPLQNTFIGDVRVIMPEVPLADRIIFVGTATAGIVFTTINKIVVKSIYVVNRNTIAATITASHRIGGVDTQILPNISIPANSVIALGYMVFQTNNSFVINATATNLNLLVYGEGT